MATSARLIATSFDETDGIPSATNAIIVHTGNPVRAKVLTAARAPYIKVKPERPFELLVFGGSQGARVFAIWCQARWSSSARRRASTSA